MQSCPRGIAIINPKNQRNQGIVLQLLGLVSLGFYLPWGILVGLPLMIMGGRAYRKGAVRLKALNQQAVDLTEQIHDPDTDPDQSDESMHNKVNDGVVGTLIVHALVGIYYWTNQSERKFNE